MNSSKERGKVLPIKKKNHNPRGGEQRSSSHNLFRKKMARRAQRRDGHKEVEEQWLADWPNSLFFVGQSWQKYVALLQRIEPPVNMFSPIPIWLMGEDERLGMEYFRQLKSYRHFYKKGIRSWQEAERNRKMINKITTDQTLFEDLQRSIKKGK